MDNTYDKPGKLYLQVYDKLRNQIIQEHMMPGDRLPTEKELCEAYGVSRNVLREAIKSLEITGIVESKPGVGIIIRESNMDYLLSSFVSALAYAKDDYLDKSIEEIRRVLELGFLDAAYDSLTDEDLSILKNHLHEMKKEYDRLSSQAGKNVSYGSKFAHADADFHKTLFSKIKNRLMVSIIDFFWAYDEYYKQDINYDDLFTTYDKHIRIYEALAARDRLAFHDAMHHHFSYHYIKR